jgi:large subunit ribosomal protein L2
LALLEYADKTLSYILAPDGLKVGDKVVSTNTAQEQLVPGLSLPLRLIAPATFIHCVEIEPGRGAQIARSAGGFAQLLGIEDGRAILRLPSGEQRYIHAECRATVGIVGNVDHHNASLGKAGRNRWKGRRPRVRGIAMNPVDHPNGGGGGKSKGGGGRQHLKSPWSQLAKGFPTRTKSKASNNQIIVRRNGRKVKQV